MYKEGTDSNIDYEVVSILVTKPNFRHLLLICVYKPPKGKVSKLIEFLKGIILRRENETREIWILGDFNTDWLKRDCPDTVLIMSFCKTNGLTQDMDKITRPNKKGGSCIDLIMTNSRFVNRHGIRDDIISDHYTIYCTRKKPCETHDIVQRIVTDYSKFDENQFVQLVRNLDWKEFDDCLDPNIQWSFIRTKILEILLIMCPFKRVCDRKYKPLWITPKIYQMIRKRKRLFKLYRQTGCYDILKKVYVLRNKVNSLVEKAKGDFIKHRLHQNSKNPRKFWQLINSLIKDKVDIDIGNINFKDPATDLIVDNE